MSETPKTQSGITLHSTMMIVPASNGDGHDIQITDEFDPPIKLENVSKAQMEQIVANYQEKSGAFPPGHFNATISQGEVKPPTLLEGAQIITDGEEESRASSIERLRDEAIRERGTPRRSEGFFVTHYIEQRDEAVKECLDARREATEYRDAYYEMRGLKPKPLPWEDQPDEDHE